MIRSLLLEFYPPPLELIITNTFTLIPHMYIGYVSISPWVSRLASSPLGFNLDKIKYLVTISFDIFP